MNGKVTISISDYEELKSAYETLWSCNKNQIKLHCHRDDFYGRTSFYVLEKNDIINALNDEVLRLKKVIDDLEKPVLKPIKKWWQIW